MLTMRRAESGDLATVDDVVQAAYAQYPARLGVTPMPMTADYAGLIGAGAVRVAEREGTVVGVLVLVFHADHLLIENVAVSPDDQGHGTGTELLTLAEQEAVAHGLPEVRLYTHSGMTENLRYYPRRGYVETHRQVEQGFSRVFFSKTLATPPVRATGEPGGSG